MRVLVTGGQGLLGQALERRSAGHEVRAAGRGELDVRTVDVDALAGADAVINAAAFTDVDQAEVQPAAAFAVNRDGAARLARACAARRLRLVHVSTEYVFDGRKGAPYDEDDTPAPLNVYGASKAEGEAAVLDAYPAALVVRTSWLFGATGRSFLRATLARARGAEVVQVLDQRGCPTWADGLADVLLALAGRSERGMLHVCGSPPVSRVEWAESIVENARTLAPLACRRVESAQFAGSAPRPSVVLSTARARGLGLDAGDWQAGLTVALAEMLTK